MTTKAKLAIVMVVCGVAFAALWALQQATGEGGLHDPTQDRTGGRLVAEREATVGKLAAPAVKDLSERTEVPPKPVAESKLGSLLVKVIWADDKKPAAGVLLRTWHARRNSLFDRRSGIADRNGTLLVENLWPGPVYVQSYRGDLDGGQKVAHIKAGKQTQAQILVPIGLNLDGIVVDQDGNPVADAILIVAPRSGWSGGYAAPIAKSEADGRFHLRGIGIHCHIGARASGHAPSLLHAINGKEGDSREVRIVLGGRGGGISGRVLDPRGQPVRNAVIQVGEEGRYPRVRPPGEGQGLMPVPVRAHTDDDGHFVAAGLAPGRVPVAVCAKGLAPWFDTVEVLPGGDTEVLVHLLPPATLSGTARDGDGQPLANVSVRAVSKTHRIFGRRSMRTEADGNYRLEDLGPGKLHIYARSKEGRAETELVVVSGQTSQWNPVLSKGLMLRGRVLDERDRPATMVRIYAGLQNPGKNKWSRWAQTDKEGRFVVTGCLPGKKIRLQLQSESHVLTNVFVEPDHKDLVIRMQSLGKPSVYFTGQVLGPNGKPVEECSIRPFDQRGHKSYRKPITDDAGRFKHGPYPPGRYRVFIQASGYPMVQTGFRELGENDTWDLGVVRLDRPGFLQVKLRGEPSLLPETGWFGLRNTSTKETVDYLQIRNGKTNRSSPLAPGTYCLQVRGKDCLWTRHEFQIQAGRDTHLEVPISRGIPVMLEFAIKVNDRLIPVPLGETRVEIKDRTGRMILSATASGVDNNELLRKLEFSMRPGKYKVGATFTASVAPLCARGEAALTVGDKKSAAPQRIVLR